MSTICIVSLACNCWQYRERSRTQKETGQPAAGSEGQAQEIARLTADNAALTRDKEQLTADKERLTKANEELAARPEQAALDTLQELLEEFREEYAGPELDIAGTAKQSAG